MEVKSVWKFRNLYSSDNLEQRSGAQVVVVNQGETQCIGYMSRAETTKGTRLEYSTQSLYTHLGGNIRKPLQLHMYVVELVELVLPLASGIPIIVICVPEAPTSQHILYFYKNKN